MCIQNSQRCGFAKETFNHRQPVADVADDKPSNTESERSNFLCLVKNPSQPEFLRQSQTLKRLHDGDRGSREKGLHVQKSRSCYF